MAESALVPYNPGHIAEPLTGDKPGSDDDVSRLVQFYEEAEDASVTAREKAERDRDYVDNKQLTEDEFRSLERRGQPPITLNVIRSRAAFLAGMEKKQRRDPKAYPRNNPNDVGAAEAFTDGMRFCVETADYATKRSQAWKNITVEGFGGVEVSASQKSDGSWVFKIARIPWDRLFYDPHSSEPDFSDARYVGQVIWRDYDEALESAKAAGQVDEARAREILDGTLSGAPRSGSTYDDKPGSRRWADAVRKRVRVVMMWHREADGWHYCEFTKAGKLAYVHAPYVDQDGESYCPWILESANVDRENNRYGEVRHLIDPQDEINKRRSKALHLLNTTGVIADAGAVDDVNAARKELAKPDFWITKNVGRDLTIQRASDLAAGQAQLGAQAMAYVDQAGPNGALLGKGVQDQSGRAIEAQQAGGLVEQSDLMDTLRRFDWRVFTVLASMMKQFWDQQMWVRVTDDEDVPRFVGLNEPMYTDVETGETKPEGEWKKLIEAGEPVGQLQPAVDPETGEPMLNNHVARLDMDILVSDAPDTISLDGENYQAILQLMGLGLPLGMLKFAIEMHPGLPAKRKKQLIDMLDQMGAKEPSPLEAERARLQKEDAEAKIAKTRSETYKNLATGEKTMVEAHGMPAAEVPRPDVEAGMMDEGPPMGPPGGQGGPPGPEPMMDGPPGPPMPEPPPGPPQGPPPEPMQGGAPGMGALMTA